MQIDVEIDPNKKSALSNGFAACDLYVAELGLRERLFLPYDEFHRYHGARETLVDDFLFVSAVCYTIDLLISRRTAPDNWTRELTVTIPVRSAELWNSQAALFTELVTFLTGDKWNIAFSKRLVPLYIQRKTRRIRRRFAADIVCLFSGGLDSFLGAIDCLSTSTKHIALVGHYDIGLARSSQSALFQGLLNAFGRQRVHLFQGRIGFQRVGGIDESSSFGESTQRSRSLIFIALGVYIAHQQRSDTNPPLLIPENGFIALNPPLTSSRLGSCSTKTVHPHFLEKLQLLINNLGLQTQISNPFIGKTKGEMLIASPRLELATSLAPVSVSCAHPTRRQNWVRRNVTHCGYCIPCLVRRAALHYAGMDDGTQYGIDVLTGELDIYDEVVADFRAVLSLLYSWQKNPNAVEKLVNRMTLPEDLYAQAATVISAQLKEFHALITTKATRDILKWAGLI